MSGVLLDSSSTKYIDMLFGVNSMFNKGFIFIITLLFVIIGLGYGLMTKTIKNNNDIAESLGYSLDGIGSILVLLFFASLFINIYDESGIGMVLVAWISKIIGGLKFSGIGLILTVFALVALVNIFCPSSTLKWSMLSGNTVTVLMTESISPEFAQIIFSAADSVTKGLTPLFMYYVIYIAFLEKYNKSNETITLFGSTKYMIPYATYITVIWAVVLVAWYLIGLPIGINTLPGVTYGA